MALSSTEAEYYGISDVVTELLFIKSLLEFMGIKVQLPIIVRVDNIGAIYLSGNASSSTRTKHIDTRYHFVKDYIEDGIVKIKFVKSEDNDTDLFTKNLSNSDFQKYMEKFMEG